MKKGVIFTVGLAVLAGALLWFGHGAATGQEPDAQDQLSSQQMTLQVPQDVSIIGEGGDTVTVSLPKSEDFEDPGNWPNDWILSSTHEAYWGPNRCLAYEGMYDGWMEAFGPNGHPSHSDSPSPCTQPTGYNDNEQSWLVYGPFSLAGATSGGVESQIWVDSEFEHDRCGVLASTDCQNFTGTSYWGDSTGWMDYPPEYLDFSDWPGLGSLLDEPQVCVAFIFLSDGSHTGPEDMGCFLDNIDITGGDDQCSLTMEVSPPGSGTTNPAVGTHPYPCGTMVNVSATPAQDYLFVEWSGDCSGTNPNTSVFVDSGKTCVANFRLDGPGCPQCGDVNCDNTVDVVDALFILQYEVGLRDTLCDPCCPWP